jgi:flagellar biosynthesis/type III secretory pathway protein FliH
MYVTLVGNDVIFDGEKVARLFDINATTRFRLEETFKRTEISQEELEDKIKEAYSEGKLDGYQEGRTDFCTEEGCSEDT